MRRMVLAGGMLIATACAAHRDDSRGATTNPPAARPELPAQPTTGSGALRVAITIDDLGVSEKSADPALSRQILQALRGHAAPVAVFANCQHLTEEVLLLWRRAGATLGNHTATHLSLDAAGPDETWLRDVEACDQQLRRAWGDPVRFFRLPYLRYGKTATFRDGAAHELRALRYSVAHVTAATSEWLLAGYYDEASTRGDQELMRELSQAYVEHMVEALQAARELALQKIGRDVDQVTLLHVNQLAADHLPEVLDALRARGWQFVSLESALSDEVYARRDAYAGTCGCSWLARVDPALTPGADYAFGDFEQRLRERFEPRVRASQR